MYTIFLFAKRANDPSLLQSLHTEPFHHGQPLDGGVSFRMTRHRARFCPCFLMTESNIDLQMFQINNFHYFKSRHTQQRNVVFIKVHCVVLCGEKGRKKKETAISTVRLL